MTDIATPVGRLVQGSLKMQQRKDTKTKQPLVKADGTPDMGCFFSVAFPKVLPSGLSNNEWAAMYAQLAATAAAAWPQFFPQGPGGACTNPKFSWKYQDGDGFDTNGQSVADKPGFKGHHILKFDTSYPVKAFNDGKFAPHEELQNADQIIKRGYWIKVFCEAKSNNADLSQQQVPGISIYPKLVSFIGGRKEDEIASGPDAQAAFGGAAVGWRPDGVSTVPGAPVGVTGPGVLPAPPSTLVPPMPTPPVAPTYAVRADLFAQGHTLQTITAHCGTVEAAVAQGFLTVQQPAPPPLPMPTPSLPAPGIPMPTPGVVLPTPPVAAGPVYALIPSLVSQGVTLDALIAKGWTAEALVQAGHATRVG